MKINLVNRQQRSWVNMHVQLCIFEKTHLDYCKHKQSCINWQRDNLGKKQEKIRECYTIWYVYDMQIVNMCLTLSSPVVSNGYTSKCSGPYWSNPLFLIFWHLGTLALSRVPKCQKSKKSGLELYGHESFSRLIFATVRKNVRLKGLKTVE